MILNGIKVVEFSEVFQAPVAAQVLGDFGADVIKVERPPKGDLVRGMDPKATADGQMSGLFAAVNRNKRSVLLDLKSSTGRKAALELVKNADVLIHNYRPGAMERLGLGFDELSVLHPRLIYACTSGYGETGPMSGLGGQDMAIQSISGLAMGSAGSDKIPRITDCPIVDFSAGMLLVQGVLLALYEREKSGKGQKVSTSLLNAALAMQTLEATSHLMYGRTPKWFDNTLNFVFQTGDGWITVLGFFRPNPLQLICKALGMSDLSDGGQLTLSQQLERREEFRVIFEPRFLELTTAEAAARLAREDIICAAVLGIKDTLELEQVRASAMITDLPMLGQSGCKGISNPINMSRTPATVRSAPPPLGHHTDEVLKELGLGDH